MITDLNISDFLILGTATALCLILLLSKSVLRVLLAFLCLLLVVGFVFLLFNSGFLFVTQLLLYVGGVTVLIVFVIMLSKRISKDKSLVSENHNYLSGLVVALPVGGILIYGLKRKTFCNKSLPIDEVKSIGTAIVTDYLIAFELLAVFLLIALILAAVIAGKKETE